MTRGKQLYGVFADNSQTSINCLRYKIWEFIQRSFNRGNNDLSAYPPSWRLSILRIIWKASSMGFPPLNQGERLTVTKWSYPCLARYPHALH